MMRSTLCLVASTVLIASPTRALAQEPARDGCPPGGWFCDETDSTEEDAAADETSADSPPSDSQTPRTEPGASQAQQRNGKPSHSVVVVTPGDEPPPKVVVLQRGTEPPPPPITRSHRQFYREMGINLRVEGVLMGSGDAPRTHSSGMDGLGMSFRYRPVPHFAFDAGLDVLSGHDWYGYERRETALLLSGIVFFNPFSPVQFYLIGGFGFSGAEVDVATTGTNGQTATDRREYSYFGAHLGPGLEFRVGRRVGLNFDLMGFIRGRTDDAAASQPEFVDPKNSARTTNTSGGGLLRGGLTFYW